MPPGSSWVGIEVTRPGPITAPVGVVVGAIATSVPVVLVAEGAVVPCARFGALVGMVGKLVPGSATVVGLLGIAATLRIATTTIQVRASNKVWLVRAK